MLRWIGLTGPFVAVMAVIASCNTSSTQSTTSGAESQRQATTSSALAQSQTTESAPSEIENLAPTDDVLRGQCQSAADLLGFAVPCPTALPATVQPVRCQTPADFAAAEATPKEGCALGSGFILEPTRFINPDLFHFVIEGAESFRSDCGEPDPHRMVQIGDVDGMLIDCSEVAGLLANHVVVRYRANDVFVEVSVHGHTEYNRHLVVAVAKLVTMIEPS